MGAEQGPNRQVLHKQAREIVFRFCSYLKSKADAGQPLCNVKVQHCAAKACFQRSVLISRENSRTMERGK
jgi:hypothetical protein